MEKVGVIFCLLALVLLLCKTCYPDVYEQMPHGKMYRNVKDFGAKGDGISDDTEAFIKALNYGVGKIGEKKHGTVFVPSGKYVIKDTLVIWKGTHFIGDSENPPTLILPPFTFSDPANLKPLIVTANGWGIDPETRNWKTRRDDLGGLTNNTFHTSMRNFKIEIGEGNQGCIGIYWLVAQATSLRNIEINGNDAYACIKSSLWGGGGVIQNVKVIGGKIGWEVDQTSQFFIRNAYFKGQKEYSMKLIGVWVFSFLNLNIEDSAPVLINDGLCISFIDSKFRNIKGGYAIEADPFPRSLFFQNVEGENIGEYVKGHLPCKGRIGRWLKSEEIYVNARKIRVKEMEAKDFKAERLPDPDFPQITKGFKSITEFGIYPDMGVDQTEKFKLAIERQDKLYLPSGEYYISDTLVLKPNTVLFGEHPCIIHLVGNNERFLDIGNPSPMIITPADENATTTLVNVSLRISENLKGAYFLEWRAGEKSRLFDCYIWGVHDFLPYYWKIEGGGGGIFENVWWPSGPSGQGKTGAIVESKGKKWFYAWHHEHFQGYPVIFQNAENAFVSVFQFENDAPVSVLMGNSKNITIIGTLVANWLITNPSFYIVDNSSHIEIFNMAWIGAHKGVIRKEDLYKPGSEIWMRTFPDTSAWKVIGGWIEK